MKERKFHCYQLKMEGHQTGTKSAYVYESSDYAILQSYATVVAFINKKTKKPYIRGYYSRTTSRHVNRFLNEYGYPSVYRKQYGKFSYPRSWKNIADKRWN